jgi:hypothetical protein
MRGSIVSILAGLACIFVGAGARTANAQSAIPVTFSGIVIDDDRAPLADAELALRRGQTTVKVRSGDDGRFTFTDVPSGVAVITVRRLGYQQRNIDVQVAATTARVPLEVALVPIATDVEAVVIDAKKGHLREFMVRRQQSNFGYFFDQNEIRTKSPRHVSELFRTVPGATIRASGRTGGNTVRLRGCQPRVWLDGVRAQDAEVDEVISPSEVGGIEIYPSFAGVPPQYMDKENRACGVVVIWTRQY